ncbi:MAG: hypothetical protein M1837_005903 [Sclerophora amabilis]|nr:MAG: hypothetical protein M1837_005903 [Sclerophora amabilis]
MFPPIEQCVCEKNPQFFALYKQLTTSTLKPDGSTREKGPKLTERSFDEDLKNAQRESAKSDILRNSLSCVSTNTKEIPEELQEVVELLSALLTSDLDLETKELLQDDVEFFKDHIKPIGVSLSQYLRQTMVDLSAIAKPLLSVDRPLNKISTPDSVNSQHLQLLDSHEQLAAQRIKLTTTACAVLDAHVRLFEAIIRVLEQTKHGSVARNVKAQAEHLAVVAESMEAKLRLMKHDALSAIYTEEVRTALTRYEDHLQDTDVRMRQRQKTAEEELARYASKGGDDMKDIVARYDGVLKETEAIRMDIKRLGGEV